MDFEKKGKPIELITDNDDHYDYFKKLAEYEDLEEKGLLLRLPCKVGDKVYEPRPDRGFIMQKHLAALYSLCYNNQDKHTLLSIFQHDFLRKWPKIQI